MQDTFTVEFIERELVDIELVVKELIDIELAVIDVIPRKTYVTELNDVSIDNPQNGESLIYEDGYWVNKTISEKELGKIIPNETPININALPSKRFSITNPFVTSKLEVYLNGVKIHSSEITIHSSTEFSYPIDIIATDKVECSYIKQ